WRDALYDSATAGAQSLRGSIIQRKARASCSEIVSMIRVYSLSERNRSGGVMLKSIFSRTLVLTLMLAGLAVAQEIHLPPMVRQGPNTSNIPVRSQEEADRERARKANEMLQMEIKRDTEKLFQLTTELKDSVDRSDRGVLPADTLKKAEQVEKLAHSVKSKIKQSY